ncbi:MAG: DUF2064 domain-containing protein [Flavobacteriales bacterium]|nr:DUF2064 domain-containing protein [Flavobacteriales bacterium]
MDAHNKCVNAGLPVYHLDENMQKGSNFAERLQSAFQHVYDEGYENVIAVGNDCPWLSVKDIKIAEASIHKGKVILGETNRGGVYLLGLSQTQFRSLDLGDINWGTGKVFEQLCDSLSMNAELSLLKRKTEYNNEEDLSEVTYHLNNKLYGWLLSQAVHNEPKMEELMTIFSLDLDGVHDHRGPPLK